MSRDTGFAPCYDDGVFTLACCKPRIRKSVFNRLDGSGKLNDEVWIIGAKHDGKPKNHCYKSYIVYIARITKVLRFEDYYTENHFNRADCIYQRLKTDECQKAINSRINLEKIKKNKTRIKSPENSHYCKTDEFRKDMSGLCVLYSDDFYYLGDGEDSRHPVFKDVFEHCKKQRPGDFFYADFNVNNLREALKQFEKQGLKNKKNIMPIDKEISCKNCSCKE